MWPGVNTGTSVQPGPAMASPSARWMSGSKSGSAGLDRRLAVGRRGGERADDRGADRAGEGARRRRMVDMGVG